MIFFQTGERFENGNLKSLGHYENLKGFRGEIITGDLNSQEDLNRLREFKFDYIFHQAAISDTTAKNQNIMLRTNLNSFRDILKMAKEMNSHIDLCK